MKIAVLLVLGLALAAAESFKKIEDQYFIRLDADLYPTKVEMQEFSEMIESKYKIYGIRSHVLGSLKLLFVKGEHKNVMKAESLPGVIYVIQNQEIRAAQEPECQSNSVPGVWGLDRVDQREKLPYAPDPFSEEAEYIWGPDQGNSAVVYVADTGIETSHPEFHGRARWGFTASTLPTDGDYNGHGTHISGTIGGFTYGLAKAVTLIDVKILGDDAFATTGEAIEGLEWILQDHTDRSFWETPHAKSVVNLSVTSIGHQPFDDAVVACIEAGVNVVPAAGNQDDDACVYSPGRVPTALTVGGINVDDTSMSYSNYGSCVDIYAPGEWILSTFIGGESEYMSGTSMAAPHICGVVARYIHTFEVTPTPAEV